MASKYDVNTGRRVFDVGTFPPREGYIKDDTGMQHYFGFGTMGPAISRGGSRKKDVMNDWRFDVKESHGQEVSGLIYKGVCGPPLGEWVARLYRLGDVSLARLVDRKENGMRAVYLVMVVEPQTEEVTGPFYVVAKSTESARFKAAKQAGIEDIEDFDIIPVRLGDVRPKKVIQEVKIVGS